MATELDRNVRDYFLGSDQAFSMILELHFECILELSKVVENSNPDYKGLGEVISSGLIEKCNSVREKINRSNNSDHFFDGFNGRFDKFIENTRRSI